RDGKTTSTRRVKALQHGKPIFYMTASFQEPISGFDHQVAMPEVAGPAGLADDSEHIKALAQHLPSKVREKWLSSQPISMRQVNYVNPMAPEKAEPLRYIWL